MSEKSTNIEKTKSRLRRPSSGAKPDMSAAYSKHSELTNQKKHKLTLQIPEETYELLRLTAFNRRKTLTALVTEAVHDSYDKPTDQG